MSATTRRRKGEWLEISGLSFPDGDSLPNVAEELGIPSKVWTKLQREGGLQASGERLRLRLFPRQSPGFDPEWHDIDILYEDDYCLVAAKPAGMAVHPTEPGQGGTLANAVAWHYESTGQDVAVRHVHRLDTDTTGPVLYAKNWLAQTKLDEAMRDKAIGRTYIAFVQGIVAEERLRIDAPIGRDRHHPSRRRVSAQGDPAVTHMETIERYERATLVRLKLETGRTHQIRVHLSYLGYPLLGDTLYGGSAALIGRQALHGESLDFPHPMEGVNVRVETAWPADLLRLADKLRGFVK